MSVSAFPHAGAVGLQRFSLANLASSYQDTGGPTATYQVDLTIRETDDGTIDVTRAQSANSPDEETYIDPANGRNMWIRCTQNSGDALNVGDTLSTWHSLTTAQSRQFGLSYTSGGGVDLASANITLELATDSGGVNIVASKTLDLTAGESA